MTSPATVTHLDEATATGWLKREVAVPGTFDALFPNTQDNDLAAALTDGLYRAKLDGWMPSVDADPDTYIVTPAISRTGLAVIVVYTAVTFLQNQITNMASRQTYKAPGVESTTEHSAGVLKERLVELAAEKKELLANARASRGGSPVYMQDGYAIRVSALYGPEIPLYVGNTPAELTRY